MHCQVNCPCLLFMEQRASQTSVHGVEIHKTTLENKLALLIHTYNLCVQEILHQRNLHTGPLDGWCSIIEVATHTKMSFSVCRGAALSGKQRSGESPLTAPDIGPREPTLGHKIHKIPTKYRVHVNNQATLSLLTLLFQHF